MGLEIKQPQQAKGPDTTKKREPPKFEIPLQNEDGTELTVANLAEHLNKGLTNLAQYFGETLEERTGSVKAEIERAKMADVATQVKKFAKEHQDFDELMPFIEPFFNAGRSIEEAYTLGKRAAGKGEEKPKAKPTEPARPSYSPSVKTDEGAAPETLTTAKKPGTVRDAAKKNLTALLSEMGEDVLTQPEE